MSKPLDDELPFTNHGVGLPCTLYVFSEVDHRSPHGRELSVTEDEGVVRTWLEDNPGNGRAWKVRLMPEQEITP